MIDNCKPTIYIPIEVKNRELDSQLLLSFLAAIEGYRIYIGSKRSIHQVLLNKKEKGGIYIYKGVYDPKYSKFIKQKCNSLVILDQELSPNIEHYDLLIKRRVNPESISYIDKYFVINNFVFQSISRVYPKLSGKTVVTGWPRVDLYKKEYIGLYRKKIKEIHKENGSYLLFASDFGFLSDACLSKRLAQEKNAIENRNDLSVGTDEIYKKTGINYISEFKIFVEFLKELSKDKQIPKIIVRPHPSENIEVWHDALKDTSDLIIKRDGDIAPWILGSLGLIHRGSTTAVQAFISQISVFQLVTDNENVRKNISYQISEKVENLASFKESFFKKSKSNEMNNDIGILEDRLNINKNACGEIIKELLSENINEEPPFYPSIFFLLKIVLVDFLHKIKSKSKDYGVQSNKVKLQDGIRSDDVIKPLNMFMSVKGERSEGYCVNKLAKNLWEIEKDFKNE